MSAIRDVLRAADDSGGRGTDAASTRPSRAMLAVVAAMALVPVAFGEYYLYLVTSALIFGIFALSVDFVWGYGGIWVFGHAAFFGLGAYVMGKVLSATTIPAAPYLGLALAVILPALAGLVIAYALFSQGIEDFFFALITLAIAMIGQQAALALRDLTGGYDGLAGIPAIAFGVPGIEPVPMTGVLGDYFVLTILFAVFLLCWRTIRSPFGRVMVAIRENPEKARSLGYDVLVHRTLAFGLSGAIAGLAGALYAAHSGFVSPDLLGFLLSAEVVFWVLIGGRGTLAGAVVGAIFLTILDNLLSGAFQFSWRLFLGLLFVLIVLTFPDGIWGFVERVRSRATAALDGRQR